MHCILSPPVYDNYVIHNNNNHHSSSSCSSPPTSTLLPISLQQQKQQQQQQQLLPLVPSPTSLSFSNHFKSGFLCPLDFPTIPQGEILLPIECGSNQAILYLSKLCQGSKGPCIFFNSYWLTPNEFQYISGRETAKDWKRSIRHNGKSIKLLISKGVISVHSPICECGNISGSGNHHGSSSLRRMELLHNNHHSFTPTNTGPAGPRSSSPPTSHQNRNGSLLSNCSNSNSNSISIKRESRLTSIIDHLLISRTNEAEYRSCGSGSSSSPSESSDSTGDIAPPLLAASSSSSFHLPPQAASSESAEEDQPQPPPVQPTTSSSGSSSCMNNGNSGGNNNNISIGGTKIKSTKKRIKNERQSPESVRSSPSPPKHGNSGGGGGGGSGPGSDAPSPPLKQMEQMMSRNYSDFMRSLAAKYNHSNPNDLYTSSRSSSTFTFDTRFLKPGAAAAAASLLAFQQQQQQENKLPFPLIDMSSTQTLLSMVRSATAASNAAAAGNNNTGTGNSLNSSSSGICNISTAMSSSSSPTLLGGGGSIPTSLSSSGKRASSPLDLSSPGGIGSMLIQPKKMKHPTKRCGSTCSGCSNEAETISGWSVEDVCRFVTSIDLCAEYVQAFREHSIDGTSLPLLTEDHLIQSMNMKLGPALKFKSTVAKKMGNCPVCIHCVHCHSSLDHK